MIAGGCATLSPVHREAVITPHDGSPPARFAFQKGVNSGEAAIALRGSTYRGDWIYVSDPSALRTATATIRTANGPRTASGFQRDIPLSGGGRINLRSDNGAALRCEFRFSFSSGTGAGDCTDERDRRYDLQVLSVRD